MELQPLKPRRGEGTLRIDDSDDFVVIESLGQFPSNGLFPESGVYIENHGVIVVCTEGIDEAQRDHQLHVFPELQLPPDLVYCQ